jgi:hypothetical protein
MILRQRGLERLEYHHKREQFWRDGMLTVVGVEISEILVAELLEQHIANELVD